MRLEFTVKSESLNRHINHIETILGQKYFDRPTDNFSLTINYNLQLEMDDKMFEKLKAMIAMAASSDVDVVFYDKEKMNQWMEGVRLLADLENLCEMQSHRRLSDSLG